MKSDILKSLALRAKNRLLNKNLRDSYSNAKITIIDNTDNSFYSKVKDIEKQDICNPIKYLMDEEILSTLDEKGRERYLLQTVQKYRQAREQIERENRIC